MADDSNPSLDVEKTCFIYLETCKALQDQHAPLTDDQRYEPLGRLQQNALFFRLAKQKCFSELVRWQNWILSVIRSLGNLLPKSKENILHIQLAKASYHRAWQLYKFKLYVEVSIYFLSQTAKETGALQNQVEELTSKLQLEKRMRTAEEVSFAANGIIAEGIKAVDGFLQSNIALKSLNLSGNSIGDEGVKSLCDILVDNSCIQKLQLSGSSFSDEVGIFKPAGAILENKSILSIYLNSNYGGPLGAAALAKGLEGNKSLRVSFFFPSFLRNYQGFLSKTYRSGDPVTGQRNYTYMDAVKPNLGGERLRFGLRPAMLLVAAAKLTEAETELRYEPYILGKKIWALLNELRGS
ncbi:hypothetical protein ACS0TY_011454 [Phlomoides rotata]